MSTPSGEETAKPIRLPLKAISLGLTITEDVSRLVDALLDREPIARIVRDILFGLDQLDSYGGIEDLAMSARVILEKARITRVAIENDEEEDYLPPAVLFYCNETEE